MTKPYLALILFITYFCACIPKPQAQFKPRLPAFSKTLILRQVAGTPYHISLPSNYIIKESQGPDFSVYHFAPSDTSDHTSFTGGLYIGNAPALFNYYASGCKEYIIKSYLFQENEDWTVSNCNNKYRIHIIAKSKSGYGWATKVHAFGNSTSKTELDSLLDVYATLDVNKQ